MCVPTEAAVHLYLARSATVPVGLELALGPLKSSKAVNSGSAFLALLDLRGPKAGSSPTGAGQLLTSFCPDAGMSCLAGHKESECKR